MQGKIILILNQVFPKPSLPNAAFTSFSSRFRYRSILTAIGEPGFRESSFDHTPSYRKIIIVGCHFPYAVTMVGQKHDTQNLKRA